MQMVALEKAEESHVPPTVHGNEPIFALDSPGYPGDLTSRPYQNVEPKRRTKRWTKRRTQRSDGMSDAKVGRNVGRKSRT